MIGAVYGLQALVFILRRKWDMVGWMVFYILAIPIFSFLLPIYSFWRMDDFSWGATRVVLGEAGKKIVVHVRCVRCSESGLILMWRPDRTKASSIPVRFLSRLGTTTRTSCGTRNPITRSVPGFLLAINTRKATPNHGLHRCTDTRRSMNPAVTLPRRRNNSACYLLQDTSLAAARPCRNSVP